MDDETLDGSESGGSLRRALEDALAAKRSMETELFGFKASAEISANGYKHVTAEDLKGVALDDLATKAAEIEQRKAAEQEAALKSALAARGIAEDQVDAAIAALLQPEQAAQEAAQQRITQLGRIQGAAPGTIPAQTTWGVDTIAAGLAAKSKS